MNAIKERVKKIIKSNRIKILLIYFIAVIFLVARYLLGYSFSIDLLDDLLLIFVVLMPVALYLILSKAFKNSLLKLAAVLIIFFVVVGWRFFYVYAISSKEKTFNTYSIKGYRITEIEEYGGLFSKMSFKCYLNKTVLFDLMEKRIAETFTSGHYKFDDCSIDFKPLENREFIYQFNKCTDILTKKDTVILTYNEHKLATLNSQIEKNPTSYEFRIEKGVFLRTWGKYELAIEEFDKARKLDPNRSEAYREAALVYEFQGIGILGKLENSGPKYLNSRDWRVVHSKYKGNLISHSEDGTIKNHYNQIIMAGEFCTLPLPAIEKVFGRCSCKILSDGETEKLEITNSPDNRFNGIYDIHLDRYLAKHGVGQDWDCNLKLVKTDLEILFTRDCRNR